MKRIACYILLLGIFTSTVFAAKDDNSKKSKDEKKKPLTAEEQLKLLDKFLPSFVKVEYHLQSSNGKMPSRIAHSIINEKPHVIPGILISKKMIVCSDLRINPIYIKKIVACYKGKKVDAVIVRHMLKNDAILLEIKKPLAETAPLKFGRYSKEIKETYAIGYSKKSGVWNEWALSLKPWKVKPVITESGEEVFEVKNSPLLIISRKGEAMGILMNDVFRYDEKWSKSPLRWKYFSDKEMQRKKSQLEELISYAMPRATLKFRSPAKRGARGMFDFYDRSGDRNSVEKNLPAIAIGKYRAIVFAALGPKTTARLESIVFNFPKDKKIKAEFEYTLKKWGAIVVKSKTPFSKYFKLPAPSFDKMSNHLIFSAKIKVQGENTSVKVQQDRVDSYYTGRENKIYPSLDSGNGDDTFAFSSTFNLLGVSVRPRLLDANSKAGWKIGNENFVPLSIIAGEIAALPASADPNNVPVAENKEKDMAWFGVEFQKLNRGLARMNNIADETEDGKYGAIISYVYPDSPAARAGVKVGDILLRIYVEGENAPVNVKISSNNIGWTSRWRNFDSMSNEYLKNMSPPWPQTESDFAGMLTSFGIGKGYTAVFLSDSKIVKRKVKIESRPVYYASAAKFESESLGLTVKELTYEALRYFQMDKKDPGVIISKVELGSKTDVAGIKCFEIITHVNGKPVSGLKGFEDAVKKLSDELRLTVKRMTKSRVVRINLKNGN